MPPCKPLYRGAGAACKRHGKVAKIDGMTMTTHCKRHKNPGWPSCPVRRHNCKLLNFVIFNANWYSPSSGSGMQRSRMPSLASREGQSPRHIWSCWASLSHPRRWLQRAWVFSGGLGNCALFRAARRSLFFCRTPFCGPETSNLQTGLWSQQSRHRYVAQ